MKQILLSASWYNSNYFKNEPQPFLPCYQLRVWWHWTVACLCILIKEGGGRNYKLYNPLPSAIPMCHIQSKCHWISSYFTIFSNIMNKCWCYTVPHSGRCLLMRTAILIWMLLIQESISNSSEQLCKRAKQIGKIVWKWQFSDSSMLKMDVDELGRRRRKYSCDTSNIPLIFQWLLRDSEWIFIQKKK